VIFYFSIIPFISKLNKIAHSPTFCEIGYNNQKNLPPRFCGTYFDCKLPMPEDICSSKTFSCFSNDVGDGVRLTVKEKKKK
jgi:hypothetical protein